MCFSYKFIHLFFCVKNLYSEVLNSYESSFSACLLWLYLLFSFMALTNLHFNVWFTKCLTKTSEYIVTSSNSFFCFLPSPKGLHLNMSVVNALAVMHPSWNPLVKRLEKNPRLFFSSSDRHASIDADIVLLSLFRWLNLPLSK